MLFFKKRYDGGSNSGVTGYWVFEIKWLMSIVLLKFTPNHRENFHSHAFNAITFWLKGKVTEEQMHLDAKVKTLTRYKAFDLKFTPRDSVHKIHCTSPAWALSIRGPWHKKWFEYNEAQDKIITMTHGRKVITNAKDQT